MAFLETEFISAPFACLMLVLSIVGLTLTSSGELPMKGWLGFPGSCFVNTFELSSIFFVVVNFLS